MFCVYETSFSNIILLFKLVQKKKETVQVHIYGCRDLNAVQAQIKTMNSTYILDS